MEVSRILNVGENKLKVEVTKTWTNRLIGDEKYPNFTGYDIKMVKMPDCYKNNEKPNLSERKAFCTSPFYKESDALMPWVIGVCENCHTKNGKNKLMRTIYLYIVLKSLI